MENMNILVIGLGVSGIACIKGLSTMGANLYVFDESIQSVEKLKELENIKAEYFFGNNNIDKIHFDGLDLAIKSPGIKYEVPIIQKLKEKNIQIISDI